MHNEIDALVLDITEGGMFQILNHVRRHSENPADFVNTELPGRKELTVFRRQRYRFVLHSFFQHSDFMRIAGSAVYV